MKSLLIAAGLSATIGIGAIIYRLKSTNKHALVLYTSQGTGASEFVDAARRGRDLFDADTIEVNNAGDIVTTLRQADRYSIVVFSGHGTPTSFLKPGISGISTTTSTRLPTWINVDDLSSEMAPHLSGYAIVSFAGCRSGANPNEANWSSDSYRPGGSQSLAGRLRDGLARLGVRGEVRDKSVTGQAVGNPIGRVFPISTSHIGQPGIPLMDVSMGAQAHTDQANVRRWIDSVRGEKAAIWTLGGAVPSI